MFQGVNDAKRCVGLLRCSTIGQANTSIDDQRRVLQSCARERGWEYVGEIALEGVSGSVPGARTDLQELIERKRACDDFDLVLAQDTSRVTRAGGDELLYIRR